MNTYKKFRAQDSYVETYTAYKNWDVHSDNFEDYGIQTYILTGSYYDAVKHLYYPDYDTHNTMLSHSYDHYYSSTLSTTTRKLRTGSYMISIPRDIIGDYMQPLGRLEFLGRVNAPPDTYFVSGTLVDDYYTAPSPNDPAGFASASATVRDDGEGRLKMTARYDSDPNTDVFIGYVGDIIYSHGQIIVTDKIYGPIMAEASELTLKWRSIQPIYTHTFHCTSFSEEHNYTLNPTAVNIKGDELIDSLKGEEFSPYITSVGLYNEANELLAVAKLGQPLQKPKNTDLTIVVKIDF